MRLINLLRRGMILAVIAATLLAAAASQHRPLAAQGGAGNTGEILVKFKAGVPQQAIDALNAAQGAQKTGDVRGLGVHILRVPTGQNATTIAARYAHDPNVQFAEPNFIARTSATPNDPYFPGQWELAKVQAPSAWDIAQAPASAVIAVLDTGVLASQEELVGKVLAGYNFVAGSTNTADANGHGTGVAGVAAAQNNNGKAMASISWGASVLPLSVCDANGSCSFSDVASGITWAADHGARVINLSLGAAVACGGTLQSAVDYAWGKGLVIVAAAGNEGGAIDSPANCTSVLAVGATDSTDTHTSWSNYGTGLALTAPGSGVVCPLLTGGYAGCNGTSFASPMVAGAAALLLSKGASNSAAVSALERGADDLGATGWDQYYGFGRLNVYKALTLLTGGGMPPSSPSPTASPTPTPKPSSSPTASPSSSPAPSTSSSPSPAPITPAGALTVTLTNPGQGQTVKGTVSVTASVSGGTSVTKVEFSIDGALLATSASAPYKAQWNTRKASNESHMVTAKAYDSAGNIASVSVTVIVAN